MSNENEIDYYDMSDEDFLKMSPPESEQLEDNPEDHIEGAPGSRDEDGFDLDNDGSLEDQDNDEQSSSELDNDEEEEQDSESENNNDEESSEGDDDADKASEEAEKEEDKDDEDDTEEKNDQEKSESEKLLEEVFAPFKANGIEMQVKTPAEARRLMQQGANYNKKMEQLKPNLKILKKLGNNELLDESKLNYLIDLSKGDPNAISKLLKEHKIDPLTVDLDKGDGYKPNAYTVTDAEVALDETLSDLKGTSSYETTLDVVNNKWDEASRAVIRQQPENLRIISEHVELGVYDAINTEMQRQKALGNISGMSDIDAYRMVGEQMKNAGALDKFFPTQGKAPQQKQEPAKRQQQDNKAAKKAAAAPANKSASRKPSGSKPKKDVWEMSDDEFQKAMDSGSLF